MLVWSEILAKKGFLRGGLVCKLLKKVENWVWSEVRAWWRSSGGDCGGGGGGGGAGRLSLGLKKFMGFLLCVMRYLS